MPFIVFIAAVGESIHVWMKTIIYYNKGQSNAQKLSSKK